MENNKAKENFRNEINKQIKYTEQKYKYIKILECDFFLKVFLTSRSYLKIVL